MGNTPSPDGLRQRAQAFAALAEQHRRGLVATVVVTLGGFAATAFGLAPMAPEDVLLPQRLVTESVAPDDLAAQADALAELSLTLLRHDVTRGTDTPQSLLARLGVTDTAAADFLRRDPVAGRIVGGRGGKMVQAKTTDRGELAELVVRYPADGDKARTHFARLTVARSAGGFTSRVEVAPLQVQQRLGSGTIETTLFAATDAALLPDAIAGQLADVFAGEIDFHRELRRGDTFSVVYETLTADGEVVAWNEGAGRLLAAEFVNRGERHQAVWFTAGAKGGGYYDGEGRSLKRSFLASPMEFSRITSGFAMRLHPILNTWRAHKGVDYGAPTGAPIRSVADGVVEFAGRQGGYGNVVEIAHGSGRSTLYAHMSRIDVAKGQRVEQGQRIGAVGATGWATGPHLHFEFKIGGQQQDPLRVARSAAAEQVTLDAAAQARFAQLAQAMQSQLRLAESRAARTQFE